MGKRANGEGSIYQRTDGRWCASLSTEKAKRKHFLGRTRAEVAKKLTSALDEQAKGTLVTGPRQTVRQFFTQWLDAIRPSLRGRTFVRYEQFVRLHVLPDLGPLTLTKVTPQQLQRLYTSRLDAGLSPTTVNHLHALIHKALSNAVRWGIVNRNVADLVDPPRSRHFEIATLNADQARAFLDAASGHRLEALFVLAVTTGMRQGELLGLRWRDVDLDAGALQVRGSMQATPDGLRIMEPKTPGSRRQVADRCGVGGRRSRVLLCRRPSDHGERITAIVRAAAQARRPATDALSRSEAHLGDAAPWPRRAPEGRLRDARPHTYQHDARPLFARVNDHAAASR